MQYSVPHGIALLHVHVRVSILCTGVGQYWYFLLEIIAIIVGTQKICICQCVAKNYCTITILKAMKLWHDLSLVNR